MGIAPHFSMYMANFQTFKPYNMIAFIEKYMKLHSPTYSYKTKAYVDRNFIVLYMYVNNGLFY